MGSVTEPTGRTNGTINPRVTKEIPYDYVARFILTGRPANRIQEVINITVDGTFVATSVGYSVLPPANVEPGFVKKIVDSVVAAAPLLGTELFEPTVGPDGRDIEGLDRTPYLFKAAVKLVGFDFKYAIIDSGSGRELQNLHIHNVAGLGEAHGFRPFRPFAKPLTFIPRSSVRLEVEEVTRGRIFQGAELSIVLQGHKILGAGI